MAAGEAVPAPGYHGFEADAIELDDEGYAPAFCADGDLVAIQSFFERYGFVVLRDVLSVEDVAATQEDVYEMAGFHAPDGEAAAPTTAREASRQPPGLKELDKLRWNAVSGSRYNTKRGFLGFEPPWSVVAWRNRLNKSLYRVNAGLFGREDLVVKIDRYGLMRPTRFFGEDGVEQRRDEWRTEGNWIHWDQNPWEEPGFERIQGVLAISDHREDTGGFHCVPGFTHHWQRWAEANQAKRALGGLVDVPEDDPIRAHLQRIPMRPGSVVLWDARTPHGNYPNESGQWRICQYMGLHPAPTLKQQPDLVAGRREQVEFLVTTDRLPPEACAGSLEVRLLGLEPWRDGVAHTISEPSIRQIGLSRA